MRACEARCERGACEETTRTGDRDGALYVCAQTHAVAVGLTLSPGTHDTAWRMTASEKSRERGGSKARLTDDALARVALDALDAKDRGAVDASAVRDATAALLEVGLRVDALVAVAEAGRARDLACGADVRGALATGVGRRSERADVGGRAEACADG